MRCSFRSYKAEGLKKGKEVPSSAQCSHSPFCSPESQAEEEFGISGQPHIKVFTENETYSKNIKALHYFNLCCSLLGNDNV
jgi:hypothetical protein